MKQEYEALFTPWHIGNVEIKNRIVQCSMGGTSIFGWMEPNHFDKEAANFLLERAKNNVGLILPGIAPIRDTFGGKWLYQNTGKFKQLKAFMEEYHKTGAKLFIQLTAGFGRSMAVNDLMEKVYCNKALRVLAKPILDVEYLCASASPNPNRWSDKVPSRALTIKEIDEMIDAFAKTAKLCKEAGVDGIEIHAVHEGYLLDQFTMKYTNQRTDEYGGSFENRYRFPVEIVKAVKKACGKEFPVSLRYSVVSKTKGFRQGALPGEEYTEVGRDMEESERAAKYLQDAGYDMLNCDNGTYDAWYWAHPPGYMPENCNLEDVEHIKKFVDIPVVCAGRMTPKEGASAVKENKIDAVGFARQFLTDPAWVTKLMEDREEDIKPCICCHNACFNMAHYEGVPNIQDMDDTSNMSRCALNPMTMQSKKYKIVPARVSKSVAVIGGGNVAMDAARCAKRLGAENVYIVYRRGMEEMPARKEEVHHAMEEGIIFKNLNNPVKILGDENGRVRAMECIEMELGEPDASGRRKPIAKEGSNFELPVDTVIMSIGTSPNPLIRSTTPGLDTNKRGCLVVNEDTMQTTREGVYAGGDAVTGAATVILAMGAGKQAAQSIDEYLSKN